MGIARDQISKLPHIRDDAHFVCSPPVRRSSRRGGRIVRLLHYEQTARRLTQRGTGFVSDVVTEADANLVQVAAVGDEGNDRCIGDVVAAVYVNGYETRAEGGEGDDRGVGDIIASVEVNGREERAVGGEGDDRDVGDV